MTDRLRTPLAELRACLRSREGPESLARLALSLRRDPRRGAQALAAALARRMHAERAERRRVEGLFALRASLLAAGARHVAGVDEVGVGPLAGPVVAAAVVLPAAVDLPRLDDSKRLDAAARERLDLAIRAQAVTVAVTEVGVEEIDRLNVYRAALEAMRRAVCALAVDPDHVLVDARTLPELRWPQSALVRGDARDGSIAAASIVAKVHRDALMRRLALRYPGYGFERHMGYPTRAHVAALRRLGPSPLHRRSFAPVAELLRP